MRYLLFIVLAACVLLTACTYTKKDKAGREEKISRDEYNTLSN